MALDEIEFFSSQTNWGISKFENELWTPDSSKKKIDRMTNQISLELFSIEKLLNLLSFLISLNQRQFC